MQSIEKYDVLIAGGGLVGLTLAALLGREGARVCVVEQTPLSQQLQPEFDGRVSAIALGSARILSHTGAWEYMLPYAEPIFDIRVSDGDSKFHLDYHHTEVGDDPFGWIVENRHTREALRKALETVSSVTVCAPVKVTAFTAHAGHVEAALSDGKTVHASLLVCAEGKNSKLREMAGIDSIASDYKQTAIVTTIAHEKPHRGLAQERFLPAGPFAVLPMQNNQSSLVWVERTEHVASFMALPEEEFVQEIAERVGNYLGKLRTHGPRFSYPLSFSLAKHAIADRFCLVGDAAHAMHPIAGQGVNLGFRDVAVLADILLARKASGLDIGSPDALSHYQRWRRLDNASMLAMTDGLTRLFGFTLTPVRLARGLGLWAVSQMPPMKRVFMRHAMGLTGDLPRFMKEAA